METISIRRVYLAAHPGRRDTSKESQLSQIRIKKRKSILEAILAGERDPDYLESLCDKGIQASPEVIMQSLEGNYRGELVFILGHNVRRYKDLQSLIEQLRAISRNSVARAAMEKILENISVTVCDPPWPLRSARGTRRGRQQRIASY